MRAYAYNTDTLLIVATASGETNEDCETALADFMNSDVFGITYSPAFGSTGGLAGYDENCEEILSK
jgi:hypothetical protein